MGDFLVEGPRRDNPNLRGYGQQVSLVPTVDKCWAFTSSYLTVTESLLEYQELLGNEERWGILHFTVSITRFTYLLPKFLDKLHLCLAGNFRGLGLVSPVGPETWPFKPTGNLCSFHLTPSSPSYHSARRPRQKHNEIEEASTQWFF